MVGDDSYLATSLELTIAHISEVSYLRLFPQQNGILHTYPEPALILYAIASSIFLVLQFCNT